MPPSSTIQLWEPASPIRWSALIQSGPDAADFLQRLTTVNIAALEPECGQPGLFLNAQGRIQAAFTLWRLRSDDFLFEFDATDSGSFQAALLQTIDRMTFSERFQLTDPMKEWKPLWIFGESFGLDESHTRDTGSGVRLFRHPDAIFGRVWVTAWGKSADVEAWRNETLAASGTIAWSELERARIESMSPWWGHEITLDANPLEIHHSVAIAQNKGCYPGQEVIEKTISLGSPAKRLVRVLLSAAAADAKKTQPLQNGATPPLEIGTLTSVIDGRHALAVVRKIQAQIGLPVYQNGRAIGAIDSVAPIKGST